MGIVVWSILFRTDVAERPRAKGDHNERPFVDNVAEGGREMSLEFHEITRARIYNGQGQCGRKDPRPAARNGRPQTSTQPAHAKISYPLPSCGHEEIARVVSVTHLFCFSEFLSFH